MSAKENEKEKYYLSVTTFYLWCFTYGNIKLKFSLFVYLFVCLMCFLTHWGQNLNHGWPFGIQLL